MDDFHLLASKAAFSAVSLTVPKHPHKLISISTTGMYTSNITTPRINPISMSIAEVR